MTMELHHAAGMAAVAGGGVNDGPPTAVAAVPPAEDRARGEPVNWENVSPKPSEIVYGGTALVLWLAFFALGLFLPTSAMRDSIVATLEAKPRTAVAQPAPTGWFVAQFVPGAAPAAQSKPRADLGFFEVVGYVALTTIAFTVTNIAFLCLFAAFLGCMTRRWSTTFMFHPKAQSNEEVDDALKDLRRAYTTATLRGFLAYILIIAGYLIVVPEQSLNQLTPGQYARLAGAVSTIAFLVGYEPRSIARLLSQLFTGDKTPPAPTAPTAPPTVLQTAPPTGTNGKPVLASVTSPNLVDLLKALQERVEDVQAQVSQLQTPSGGAAPVQPQPPATAT